MNKFAIGVVSGVVGAAIGGATAWIFAKKKYEQQANEEIASIREFYNGKAKELAEKNTKEKENSYGYLNQAASYQSTFDAPSWKAEAECEPEIPEDEPEVEDDEEDDMADDSDIPKEGIIMEAYPKISDPPILIDENEYGSMEDHNLCTLYYYLKDKVLTDEYGEIVEDPNVAVGISNLETANYEEQSELYVRNFQRHLDYEIILFDESYVECNS